MFLSRSQRRPSPRGGSFLSQLGSTIASAFEKSRSFLGNIAHKAHSVIKAAVAPRPHNTIPAGYATPGMRPWTEKFWHPMPAQTWSQNPSPAPPMFSHATQSVVHPSYDDPYDARFPNPL